MVVAMPSTQSPEPTLSESSANEASEGSQASKKKKSGLSLSALKSPFKFLGKTYCKGCRKKCSGEVLRVNDVYFHNQCFRCKGCEQNLSQGGFFTRDKDYFCAPCYQANFGTKCSKCGQYVEGEVVTALGKTYHQNCFRCAGCQKPFPTGERVTFTGKNCLCQKCAVNDVTAATTTSVGGGSVSTPCTTTAAEEGKCAGCGAELKDGQALMALDKHYHVWCFKCKSCGTLLHGEYMGKDGEPYCERDYQSLFGVKCSYCFRFISGKVLQAGDNNHFHPTCARCTKCGEPFGDGEEMFLQGAAIWHPRCGPSPEQDNGMVVNGRQSPFAAEIDQQSTVSEIPHHHTPYAAAYGSRASSPGASLRTPRDPLHWRSTSQMAGSYASHGAFQPSLYNSSSTYSLRRPLEPGDARGSSTHLQHFHLPAARRSSSGNQGRFSTRTSMDSIPLGGGFRPVSAPPKPGYTHGRSSTLPSGATTPATPGRATLNGGNYDAVSQTSYRTDFSSDFMRASNTYTHGFRPGSRATSTTPQVITEHKIYPVHLLFTTNYKLPPDVDRCNLEKHLNDEDFEMVFAMTRDDFYSMPLWRRNDFKRRVRLF